MTTHARDDASSELRARFGQVIRTLNREHGWDLDAATQTRYCNTLTSLHAAGCPEVLLLRIATNYHHDHAIVQALHDDSHRRHSDAWAAWMPQVVAVLRHAGLCWTSDGSIDLEDLAQVARLELARSLSNYRYESRFSSWAYQVIVRSVRNELRARQASKRVGRNLPLHIPDAMVVPIVEAEHPETLVAARALAELVHTVLETHPDGRLSRIFQLWAIEDRRVVEIGTLVGLSPARVRVLQAQIADLLQQDARIRAWLSENEPLALDRL